jgi:hypothetical protein
VPGDQVTVSLDCGVAKAGNFSVLFVGSQMDPSANFLLDPRMFAYGATDSRGVLKHKTSVAPGMNGVSYFIQAMGLEPNVGLWESNTQRVAVGWEGPPDSAAAYICTPSQIHVTSNGNIVGNSNPIEWAFNQSRPGDLILVEPGDHPKFNIDKSWVQDQPMTWIRARVPGQTKILKHNVGGSSTIKLSRAGYVTIQGFEIEPSDTAGIMCDNKQPVIQSIHFIDCSMDGGYDRYSKSGRQTKWGVLGWTLSDFVWRGGKICRIKEEHAFYLHNSSGDITIEDVQIYHVGRTAFQLTARSVDSGYRPNPGSGKITLRNIDAWDCCLGDYYGGGSAFTFAGRHRDSVLLENVTYRSGFDQALNNAAGKVVGTGAFVSYHGGGSQNMNTTSITLVNCVLEIAPGGGDRDHIQVGAVDTFTMQNCVIDSGSKDAFLITGGTVGTLSLDRASQVTGVCRHSGTKYNNYQLMLDSLGM